MNLLSNIHKQVFYLQVLALILLLTASCSSKIQDKNTSELVTSSATVKPNILILHVDDLGYHDLSINGSKIYQTPIIDQLARESVRFTNAYANYPRCVPSRYAMLTGNYPVQDGDVPDDSFSIDHLEDDKNYIKAIDDAGYQTAYFGKYHLGESPTDLGFDTSVAAGHAGSPISYIAPFNVNKRKWESNKDPILDLDAIAKPGEYLTDVLTSQTIDYIKNRDSQQPFMAMLAFYNVHQPFEAKEEDIKRNRKEIKDFDYGNTLEYIKEGTGRTKMRQDNATYAAMVENTDENIGRILDMLKIEGLLNNTIIIFSSDHGGLSNDGTKERQLATSNYPLRAGKGHLYEGGIKVPFFVKANDLEPRDENSLVMLMDVFPTLANLTSNKQPVAAGQNMLPVWYDQENWNDRTVFWHSSKARPVNTGDTKSSAVRQGKYKLIHWYEEDRKELYNMEADPGEQNDLSGTMPDVVVTLSRKLTNWKKTF
ncbi:Arylsulfatase A [Nonlabens sp. Hel1_33_55]|uniref:sulfatase n=1 Tax=Nonlabens sp. Hel1_33_55 TaxID=1336802 RepID=UPI000875DE64|nr:sulfatase [Nonlabens sp. Hel1_33_55]SCX99764.1 Arylsulfatase A [Nonlabens sp. Hel1_33_55]